MSPSGSPRPTPRREPAEPRRQRGAPPGRRALLSVSDKQGLVPFAAGPRRLRVRDRVDGRHGENAARRGASASSMSLTITEFPEIMDGRVKTLHPRIHGGLLARRGVDDAVRGGARDRPHRRARGESLSVRGDGRAARTARTPKRSRTSTSAVPRCCAPRRRTTSTSRWSSIRPTIRRVLAALEEGETSRASCAARSRSRRSSHTSRYDAAISRYLRRAQRGARRVARSARCAAGGSRESLRYGENPHQQRGALPHGRARARARSRTRASCKASNCRSTTSSTPTRRSRP